MLHVALAEVLASKGICISSRTGYSKVKACCKSIRHARDEALQFVPQFQDDKEIIKVIIAKTPKAKRFPS